MGRSRFLGGTNIEKNARDLRVYMAEESGVPYQVMVSDDDTTPGYLSAKITSTDGSVVIIPLNDGADEDLDLSVAVYVADALDDHTAAADAHHNWPLLDADIPSTIARDSEVTSAISTHASDANAHHNRSHAITSAGDHTVTGAALDVVGLTATNTLGVLTPSAAVSTAVSALLKTDSNGRVQVRGLGIGMAPTSNALHIAAGILFSGDRTISSGDVSIALNDTFDLVLVDAGALRIRRWDDTRYYLNIVPTSTNVTVTSYDSTGVVKRPLVYVASSHTFNGGDVEIDQELGIGVAPGGLPIHISKDTNEMLRMTGSGTANNPFISFYADGTRKAFIQGHSNNNLYVAAPLGSMILGTDTAGGNNARITIAGGGAITVHSAITLQSAVTVDADMTITTSGNQGDRFLMTNTNVSGSTVFYDFNQTDKDAGSTGAFELGFYRDANNITQVRMSKEVFEIIIRSGGTYRFPLEVRAQQVILAELPTSNPGIIGALYRSGNDVLIST